jgi:hypothetical protein
VTPDGKYVVLWEDQPGQNTDLMLLNPGTRAFTPLFATPFWESHGMISPDGELTPTIEVILNWTEELKRQVPTR